MKTFFKPEDFREIYKKIMRDGYKSHGAGDMWEPVYRPDDIAAIANSKLDKLIEQLKEAVNQQANLISLWSDPVGRNATMQEHLLRMALRHLHAIVEQDEVMIEATKNKYWNIEREL